MRLNRLVILALMLAVAATAVVLRVAHNRSTAPPTAPAATPVVQRDISTLIAYDSDAGKLAYLSTRWSGLPGKRPSFLKMSFFINVLDLSTGRVRHLPELGSTVQAIAWRSTAEGPQLYYWKKLDDDRVGLFSADVDAPNETPERQHAVLDGDCMVFHCAWDPTGTHLATVALQGLSTVLLLGTADDPTAIAMSSWSDAPRYPMIWLDASTLGFVRTIDGAYRTGTLRLVDGTWQEELGDVLDDPDDADYLRPAGNVGDELLWHTPSLVGLGDRLLYEVGDDGTRPPVEHAAAGFGRIFIQDYYRILVADLDDSEPVFTVVGEVDPGTSLLAALGRSRLLAVDRNCIWLIELTWSGGSFVVNPLVDVYDDSHP